MVFIAHRKNVDLGILTSLQGFFESREFKTETRVKPDSIHNAIEWALPALISLWIAKSFFDGFIKEMGKDGAQALKSLIAESYKKLRGTSNKAYNADELGQMANGTSPELMGRQGPVIDVMVEISTKNEESPTSVRCVFPAGLNDVEVEVAVTTWIEDVLPSMQQEQPDRDGEDRAKFIYDQSDGWLTDYQKTMKEGMEAMRCRAQRLGQVADK